MIEDLRCRQANSGRLARLAAHRRSLPHLSVCLTPRTSLWLRRSEPRWTALAGPDRRGVVLLGRDHRGDRRLPRDRASAGRCLAGQPMPVRKPMEIVPFSAWPSAPSGVVLRVYALLREPERGALRPGGTDDHIGRGHGRGRRGLIPRWRPPPRPDPGRPPCFPHTAAGCDRHAGRSPQADDLPAAARVGDARGSRRGGPPASPRSRSSRHRGPRRGFTRTAPSLHAFRGTRRRRARALRRHRQDED